MQDLDFKQTAAVIHDIRNLLQVISTNGDLLSQTGRGPQTQWASAIAEATRSLSKLVDQVDPACCCHSRPTVTSIGYVLQNVRVILNATNPSIEVCIDLDNDFAVAIPPLDLLRAVVNLARNGAEAAESNSARHPAVRIGVTKTDRSICVNVFDTGPGFQIPFALACRCNHSTRTSQSQRGYGLAIVKSIAETYGGYIAASRLKQQTLVRLCIPREHESPLRSGSARSSDSSMLDMRRRK